MTRWLSFVLLLASMSLACVISLPQGDTDQPETTPPLDEILSFRVPLYSANLQPGESVKGTHLEYLNREGDVYQVSIDGLNATKRVGDSFSWRGVMAPGVIGNYNLRISPSLLGNSLLAAGSVQLFVLNPIAVELSNEYVINDVLYRFSGIAVDYQVPVGGQVPGTTLIFEAYDQQGALLSGTVGYPYRAVGDSLIWTGRLRGNVVVKYNLRVASADEESIRLIGTSELFITPS